MFLRNGTINGRSVKFLVDTGATSVAMNSSQAKRLGIRYRLEGKPSTVSTASGFVKAYEQNYGRVYYKNSDVNLANIHLEKG